MGKANFNCDFKRDSVRQVTGRGYPRERSFRTTGRQHPFPERMEG